MSCGLHARAPRLLTEFDRMSHMWVKKVRPVSSITVRSGGRGPRGADTWTVRSVQPLLLHDERLGWSDGSQEWNKNNSGG
jgi:hypothetical protein